MYHNISTICHNTKAANPKTKVQDDFLVFVSVKQLDICNKMVGHGTELYKHHHKTKILT